MHVGDGWFYDRENVNKYLGFDNYYFLEDYENSNRTDKLRSYTDIFSTATGYYRENGVPTAALSSEAQTYVTFFENFENYMKKNFIY